jgi:hypothetical protein
MLDCHGTCPVLPTLSKCRPFAGILYALLHVHQLVAAVGAQQDVEAALRYILSLECHADGQPGTQSRVFVRSSQPAPVLLLSSPLSGCLAWTLWYVQALEGSTQHTWALGERRSRSCTGVTAQQASYVQSAC